MRAAVIPPTPDLSIFGNLSDYHLILNHICRANPDYLEFYKNRIKAGDFVILDNSAHELGEGESWEELLETIKVLKPSEVILPDRMFFGEDTVEGSIEAWNNLKDKVPKGTLFMGVPQGRTFREYLDCAVELVIHTGISTLGISKDYEVWPGGLEALVRELNYIIDKVAKRPMQIHLLGWGRDVTHLSKLKSLENVRGVDSAKPIVYGIHGITIPDDITTTPPYPKRIPNYMTTPVPVTMYPEILRNIRRFFEEAGEEAGLVRLDERKAKFLKNP